MVIKIFLHDLRLRSSGTILPNTAIMADGLMGSLYVREKFDYRLPKISSGQRKNICETVAGVSPQRSQLESIFGVNLVNLGLQRQSMNSLKLH